MCKSLIYFIMQRIFKIDLIFVTIVIILFVRNRTGVIALIRLIVVICKYKVGLCNCSHDCITLSFIRMYVCCMKDFTCCDVWYVKSLIMYNEI